MQSGLLILAGVPAGQLFDLGYFKITTSVGATLVTVGIFMLSLVHKDAYWQVMLTQGLTIGLGSGMLYIPVLAVVGQAFPEGSGNKRAVAMGVVTAGVGVGGIAYTLAFSRLVISHTFGSTVRDLGYIMIAGFAIIMPSLFFGSTQTSNTQLTASNTGQQRERRALFDATALRDKRFMIFTLAEFFLFIAYLIPLFFTPTFATDVLGLKEQDAAVSNQSLPLYASNCSNAQDLLAISAGASSSGRLVISALVAYANLGDNPSVSILAWTACCVSAAILAFGWIGIRNDHGFIAFTVLYGFATGGIISLPPSIFPSTCCPDKKKLGTRLGMSFGVNGIAFLVGSPIGGAILGRGENDQWIGLAAFAGSIMGLGALGVGVFGVMVRKSKE